MAFEVRLLVVTLAAFASAGLAGTAVTLWLSRRPVSGAAAGRAARLLRIRLIPIGAGLTAGAIALASFLRFEPRGSHETAGWLLCGLAAIAGALIGGALWRSAAIARATRHAWRAWRPSAEPIALDDLAIPAFAVATPFPIVAVVGLWRPRLVIARSVLDACTPEEIRAILRHERHHLERRDNFRRALLAVVPDLLVLLPVSRGLMRAWHDATEEAADDFARRSRADGGVVLAQALLKVARLAPAGSFASALPASALYRGENLERRVRRLLVPPDQPAVPSRWTGAYAAAALALAALTVTSLDRVHLVMEAVVNFLP